MDCFMNPISVDALAAKIHAAWLADRDRSYSPFCNSWGNLSASDRAQISRQTRIVLDEVVKLHSGVRFIDEYAPPGPGDARWNDPLHFKQKAPTGLGQDQCSMKMQPEPPAIPRYE